MTERRALENREQTITLQHVRSVQRYNDWVFAYLRPFVGGRVLELGCGIGTYSTRLRPLAAHLTCVDMELSYVEKVHALFDADEGVTVVRGVMGDGLEFAPANFDSIVCLNVLEHIERDADALARLRAWLAPGGTLFLQVPAHQWLFGTIDVAVGHFRRYTCARLAALVQAAGFRLALPPRYLYTLAIPGWWWVGRVLRRDVVPAGGVGLANAMAAVSRAIEAVVPPPVGLTIVAAAEARSD